jgi:Reverse transcriptase (RNA-dependent DNA polymerase)
VPIIKSTYPDTPAIEVTVNGAQKLLALLSPKKSVGPDEISPHVMKETSSEIAPVLAYNFNQSLSLCQLPEDWRTANIFPSHKKDPKELPENYRPLSLTTVSSKILEHIVFSCIIHFLSEQNILTLRQHGFRPRYSCETQLVIAVDDWAKSIDKGLPTYIAIFDFGKAFDSSPFKAAYIWHPR